ncbi:MAG: response regulator [bacterium]|jgi:two-component system response regulator BaeR
MNTGRILIVEDEVKLAELLRDYLGAAGFKTELLHRGDVVVEAVRRHEPDAILLDLMLPGMEGTDVCREVRKFSEVPILMVTAKTEEIDRLLGLELGADDYICKPFSPREVVARVKAVLRRARTPQVEAPELKAGPLVLNTETRAVHVSQQLLELTPTEFGLLRALMQRPERVFSRDELLTQVQGYDFAGYDRTIDTHVKNLRKKLAPHGLDRNIGSVYGVGYRFSPPVPEES